VLTILASYYRPLTKSQLIKQSIKSLADKRRRRFVTWKGFLATQPDFVIMDMVFLVFHANELVKKKARDILASPVSERSNGIWTTGQHSGSSENLSNAERLRRAFS